MSVSARTCPTADRSHSDALVVFGFSGDLAGKKIFPALYAMMKKGHLTVPVIGVASSKWSVDEWHGHVRDSLVHKDHEGGIDDPAEAAALIADDGGWHNPAVDATTCNGQPGRSPR
jgi:glucose-6-phosphate 1-dehydrogenase